ncbi:MAG: hypothetical protein FWC79_06380 [Oscillospiraceae bacterium]|nr:hypothetical protein [Oscillospiraceae bacterium]
MEDGKIGLNAVEQYEIKSKGRGWSIASMILGIVRTGNVLHTNITFNNWSASYHICNTS